MSGLISNLATLRRNSREVGSVKSGVEYDNFLEGIEEVVGLAEEFLSRALSKEIDLCEAFLDIEHAVDCLSGEALDSVHHVPDRFASRLSSIREGLVQLDGMISLKAA